ncbi:Terminal uridylyltransferase 7 [Symbiodinium microadriaticum]|uniref:Terminal uridylyltransferase 7 n=1 Tax=Symbiodinium microadriaticum TaxID=2951 RepID=A0A1Q9DTB3_SYMMI|nr:Terminal uridylyltransferase 7 [Symbiodinium microadriaticum]
MAQSPPCEGTLPPSARKRPPWTGVAPIASRRDIRDFKRPSQRSPQLQVSCLEQEARARLALLAVPPTALVQRQESRAPSSLASRDVVYGALQFSDLDATCYELPEEGKEPSFGRDCKGQSHGQLMAARRQEPEQQQPAAEVLSERLAPLLRKHKSFDIAQEVLHARVPILKLCFEGKLEVDLSCHNTLPLQNTKLLKAYSTLDDRVKELVILVKLWAKDRGVCGASRSHLSSYALTLMAIYFMQVHPKISLPMLPPQAFKDDSHVDVGAKVEEKPVPGQEFSWGSEVVSVRLPNRLDASENHLVKLKGRLDPVDETRNLNCVLGDAQDLCICYLI